MTVLPGHMEIKVLFPVPRPHHVGRIRHTRTILSYLDPEPSGRTSQHILRLLYFERHSALSDLVLGGRQPRTPCGVLSLQGPPVKPHRMATLLGVTVLPGGMFPAGPFGEPSRRTHRPSSWIYMPTPLSEIQRRSLPRKTGGFHPGSDLLRAGES